MMAPFARRQQRGDEHGELLDVLAVIGRTARTGATLSMCLAEAHRCSPGAGAAQIGDVLAAARVVGLVNALQDWGAREEPARRAAWAMAVAAETGGDLSAAVESVVVGMRAERSLLRELSALTAQAKLSALVLACVPVGFGALMTATDSRARMFTLGTLAGRACLVVGVGLDVFAWRWLRRLGAVAW